MKKIMPSNFICTPAVLCFIALVSLFEADSLAQEQKNSFLIQGRPEAPILENDKIPAPSLPDLIAESAYDGMSYQDLLRDPELVFLYRKDEFLIDLDKLQNELENISVSENEEH